MPRTAIDLFAGAGGASQGLRNAGFGVLAAVENDEHAAHSYQLNHPTTQVWAQDIRRVSASGMRRDLRLNKRELTLLKACPPCQGFSSLARFSERDDAARNDLVLDVLRFVRVFMPACVLLENVPGLARDFRFELLRADMTRLGYVHEKYVVDATVFGVPQRRKRLVLVAFRGLRTPAPSPDAATFFGGAALTSVPTVSEVFAGLPVELTKGPIARHRRLSGIAQRRVEAIPTGGNRFDLPVNLQLACHKSLEETGRRVATGSYGRMRADEVAPTMTTRCTTPACGSFIHPTENRGISLREAAALQTFPAKYQFAGGYDSIERQIGNAIPVLMAQVIGSAVLAHARV